MRKGEESVKIVKRFSEALKRKVVEEVLSGMLTRREAARLYGLSSKRIIDRWIFLQTGRRTKVVRVVMKNEIERIRELEEALADERLGRRVMAAQLEAYEKYVPDLKKRLNTKELKRFEENQDKIAQLR